jgi:diguanylate cyclase (GGDEF)-like protein
VIADDDRLARELLAGILRNAGHTVDAVEDGQEAVDRVAQGGVDLVLLDVVMPRLSGLEACRLLKGMLVEGFLPVVLVTVKTDTQSRVEGLRIGADDYVCKPFEEAELVARVGSMLRIKRLHDLVTVQKARFERLSVHDELTGLYNYRYLHTRLNEEFKRAERYHEPFACVLVDIDQLRAINDLGGRPAGDAAIRKVAEGIKRCVREVDVVARYGGEEFLIVLPSTHFAGSVVVAERIWREVSGRPVDVDTRSDAERRSAPPPPPRKPWDPPAAAAAVAVDPRWADGPRELMVSIGVALYPSRDVRTKDALIRASESALSQAKREGGNRICVYQQQGYIYTPSIAGSSRSSQDAPASSRSPGPVTTGSPAGGPASTRSSAAGSSSSGPASSRTPLTSGPGSSRGEALPGRPRRPTSDSARPPAGYDGAVGSPRPRPSDAPDSQETGRKSS